MRSSKALESAGYEPASRTLRVRFRGGGLYDYHDVPSGVYHELTMAAHPWTRWGEHIKSTYRFTRIE